MSDAFETTCEDCGTPVAWAELVRDEFGASGSCPVCATLIVRPRPRPRPVEELAGSATA